MSQYLSALSMKIAFAYQCYNTFLWLRKLKRRKKSERKLQEVEDISVNAIVAEDLVGGVKM